MASTVVIDCTNDLNIHNFLNSEKCQDLRIASVHLDNLDSLPNTLSKFTPSCIILTTSNIGIQDMYKAISENFTTFKFILCVGETRIKRDKQKLKLLQEEYNCYIIENVVTDFLLLNYILECTPQDATYNTEVIHDVISATQSTRHQPVAPREVHAPLPQKEDYNNPITKQTYEPLPKQEETYEPLPKQEDTYDSLPKQEDTYEPLPKQEDTYEPLPKREEIYEPLPKKPIPQTEEPSIILGPKKVIEEEYSPTIKNVASIPNRIGEELDDFDFDSLDTLGDSVATQLTSNTKDTMLSEINKPKPDDKPKKSNVVSIQQFTNQKPKPSAQGKSDDGPDEDHVFE